MKFTLIVRTLFSWFLFFILITIFFIPMVIFACIPFEWRFSSKSIFRCVHLFYVMILKCSLLPIKYSGLENIPQEPVIFAANHQSSLDIPLVGVLSKGIPHAFLAKQELVTESWSYRFIVPMISILVDVTSARAAMFSVRKIINLASGYDRNIIIFPEGSRFTDGKIHEFFGGFVILAKKMGRPIVPVCIVGVNKVYPPDSFWVYWHPITVIVGKPFVYQEDDTDETFKQRVYNWFVEQMGKNT